MESFGEKIGGSEEIKAEDRWVGRTVTDINDIRVLRKERERCNPSYILKTILLLILLCTNDSNIRMRNCGLLGEGALFNS